MQPLASSCEAACQSAIVGNVCVAKAFVTAKCAMAKCARPSPTHGSQPVASMTTHPSP